jgi:hypothetical protein
MKTSLVILAAVALLTVGAGQAFAQAGAAKPTTVTVAMKDPGCHWFAVKGKFLKTLSVAGPVKLANLDEATLLVAGKGGLKKALVGKPLALGTGVYHITMVGQAPDDNHLKLVVR